MFATRFGKTIPSMLQSRASVNRFIVANSQRRISFFKKGDVYIDLAKKKIRTTSTSVKVVVFLVAVSWVVIFKLWFHAEEAVKVRAQKYYEEGGSLDVRLAEEYRSEYINKQKLKIKQQLNERDGKDLKP
eukprot:TRINITY_DN1743_c0_g1_i1.p2 TRINITY_DN1743_c0_g1~~TRINITY_DN1743_c0_g1_i1.p2  ORF type:complete len:130 (+),score=37.04 TRINITY_DN1743_c0_g1_i1:26-415(+)